MLTTTNPDNHKPPLWVYGGAKPATDDFKRNPRCNCIGRQEYFFSDDLSYRAIAQSLCATCPMLHPCTRWTLENFLFLPDGIFAGMDYEWRARIYSGKETYWDWAKGFNRARKLTRANYRKREQMGMAKRDQRLIEIPLCPRCQHNQDVVRRGRDKATDRQQYACTTCRRSFLGEEI
jgi:uncharacterized protein YbaR (Trm112 family)